MRTQLVVVESMWGNTRAVAEAVARGLGEGAKVLDVSEAPAALPPEVDLLVIGGPTHVLSMSRERTRADAVQKGAPDGHSEQGIREWLDSLPGSGHVDIATFDTKVAKGGRFAGSAAKAAGKRVRRHHLGRLVDTESFYVEDMTGPLAPGELDRAEAWGTRLASTNATA